MEKSEENKDRDGIFRGIAIFVNGYTDPTADELKRIMMVNGGIYHHYKSSKTTHIIGKKISFYLLSKASYFWKCTRTQISN